MSGEDIQRGSDVLDVPASPDELIGDRERIAALMGATMRVVSDAASHIQKSGWNGPEFRQALDSGEIPPVAIGRLVWRGTPPSWSLLVLTAPLEDDNKYSVGTGAIPESMGGALDVKVPGVEDLTTLIPEDEGDGRFRDYPLIQFGEEASPEVWAQAAWDAATAVNAWQQQRSSGV